MERLVPNSSIRQRKAISASERTFLEAIAKVLDEHKSYWPISLRRVHYSLLNQNVVRNTRTGSIYVKTTAATMRVATSCSGRASLASCLGKRSKTLGARPSPPGAGRAKRISSRTRRRSSSKATTATSCRAKTPTSRLPSRSSPSSRSSGPSRTGPLLPMGHVLGHGQPDDLRSL